MANHHVLDKDLLVKEPKTVKVSAIPMSTGTDASKLVSLEVYADNKKRGVQYLVLTCPTVFVQTLGKMSLDTELVCLLVFFRHLISIITL